MVSSPRSPRVRRDLADPVERFRAFKTPPGAAAAIDRGDFVTQHLLSSGGSGRWQFWSAAVDQWRQAHVRGDGAGSFEAWWAQHGSIGLFVKDAHSSTSRRSESSVSSGWLSFSPSCAAGSASEPCAQESWAAPECTGPPRPQFSSYATAAGIDWVWELTAVSVVGFVSLARSRAGDCRPDAARGRGSRRAQPVEAASRARRRGDRPRVSPRPRPRDPALRSARDRPQSSCRQTWRPR